MKILIVCSRNSGRVAPFIVEQAESLRQAGIELDFFYVEKKGITGYLFSRKDLKIKLHHFSPDLIHAHYGLSGLLANLQRRIPVVTTFHGSDIHLRSVFPFSWICALLSTHNIFISDKLLQKTGFDKKSSVIPCGVDPAVFFPLEKNSSRKQLGWSTQQKKVLFSSAFDIPVKNAPLAQQSIHQLNGVKLIELKGFSRSAVNLVINAVDVVLLTSHTEGSPQIIKEAMACNRPIVSVRVGDVESMLNQLEGCFLTAHDASEIAQKIQEAFNYEQTTGRERIYERQLDVTSVAKRVINVYKEVLHQ